MSNGKFLLFAVFSVAVITFVYWLTFVQVIPRLDDEWRARLNLTTNGESGDSVKRYGLTGFQARRLFDSNARGITVANIGAPLPTVQNDQFDGTSLEGPLVPLDCRHIPRPCLLERDCTFLCSNSASVSYECDRKSLLCVERAVGITTDAGNSGNNDDKDTSDRDSVDPSSVKCNTKAGEYALLEGYNELGVAQWNCIQLYPGWEGGGKRYCENGIVNIDARVRVPSYADCTCPSGTTRIVYARSQLGQQIYGLPHCVKQPHLYNIGTDYLKL